MWCDKCQADVAAMASPDNERLYCTTCGSALARTVGRDAPATVALAEPKAHDAALAEPVTPGTAKIGPAAPADAARTLRDPRELLARWAREDALDTLDFGAPAKRDSIEKNKPALRFDAPHPVLNAPAAAFVERTAVQRPRAPASAVIESAQPVAQEYVIHRAHAPNPPHFQPVPVSLADKSSKWVTLTGQLFAYLGVAGLTVGTVLVLMGYFGGPAGYAATGWLIATAGQMLLFLGVVTLVSGGMEQTTQEVARRIDTLGERLVRIEQAAWNGQSSTPPEQNDPPK